MDYIYLCEFKLKDLLQIQKRPELAYNQLFFWQILCCNSKKKHTIQRAAFVCQFPFSLTSYTTLVSHNNTLKLTNYALT